MSDTVFAILCFWGVSMTVAVVYLLWWSEALSGRQSQAELMLRKLQESTNAFAALVERMASRARAVKKSKAPKGK